ncbi:hypothetical protein CYMTET_9260 [Cymbomonas tetramitiformis]|uniref:Tubulin--tyrosine ligase-like protein 5 n=1 Tax=Cymbomonas tetramitiformis TaxID=36881 RepID=A0AAE0GRN7_9CHLO|nr:hypothetical protein CYMTET_9260 [Cymbomonas tetramitiformis]
MTASEDESDQNASVPTVAANPTVYLLPSQFPHRHPTIYFEYPKAFQVERGGNCRENRIPFPEEERRRKILLYGTNKNVNCVSQALKRSGFEKAPVKGKCSRAWNLFWGTHLEDAEWRKMELFQSTNHFPGSWCLGCKDQLWRRIEKLQKKFGEAFSFCPKSYNLPTGRGILAADMSQSPKSLFIVKPPGSAEGRGIRLVNKIEQIPEKEKLLVQQYLADPYLIGNKKFDLRIYVLVTSFDPLRIYVYNEGLVRFATQDYDTSSSSRTNLYMHLTNYSINKNSPTFVKNVDAALDDEGSKWSLQALWRYLEEQGANVEALREKISALVVKTMISVEDEMNSKYTNTFSAVQQKQPQDLGCADLLHSNSHSKCFELYGFDVILDARLTPWLLEVNVDPSLSSSSPLDKRIKHMLATDILHMLCLTPVDRTALLAQCEATKRERSATGVQRPTGREICMGTPLGKSTGELLKPSTRLAAQLQQLQRKPISKLCDADISLICEAEDENARRGNWERVFPAKCLEDSDPYTRFFESIRYGNQLLAKWLKEPDWEVLVARSQSMKAVEDFSRHSAMGED